MRMVRTEAKGIVSYRSIRERLKPANSQRPELIA
jgi:hypothetical protein